MENNNMSLVFSMDLIEKWSFKTHKHERSSIELIKKTPNWTQYKAAIWYSWCCTRLCSRYIHHFGCAPAITSHYIRYASGKKHLAELWFPMAADKICILTTKLENSEIAVVAQQIICNLMEIRCCKSRRSQNWLLYVEFSWIMHAWTRQYRRVVDRIVNLPIA